MGVCFLTAKLPNDRRLKNAWRFGNCTWGIKELYYGFEKFIFAIQLITMGDDYFGTSLFNFAMLG